MIRDAYDMIGKLVTDQMVYLLHYDGTIVGPTIPPSTGYLVVVPALGWDSPVVVYQRFTNGAAVRYQTGDVVDIGFVEGNRDRPVIYGKCGEYTLSATVGAGTGSETKSVLYTGPLMGNQLTHDEALGTVTLPGGIKTAPYGEDLITYLSTVVTAINTINVAVGGLLGGVNPVIPPVLPPTVAVLSKVKIP